MSKDGVIPSLYCVFGGQISNNEPFEQSHILQNLLYGLVKEDRVFVINAFHSDRLEVKPTSIANFPAFQHEEFYELNCWIPELLGLTKDVYTPVFEYNQKTKRRLFGLKLNQDVRLHFRQPETVITLKKGEVISCWKHRRENKESVLQLAYSLTMDSEMMVTNLDNSIFAYLLNKE